MQRYQTSRATGASVTVLMLLSALAATPSHALPQNAVVVGGSATVSQINPTTMNINQSSGTAVINWHGYSIGANESVKYIQPGSSSIILNRVTGVDPSYINGLLSGNGQVWVINPNGLMVGPGATVQTGSFLASTMNITNENFLSGKHLFTSAPGSPAAIVNQGSISAAQGGYVVLAAPSVTNSGSIVANMGTVHLASGDAVTLSLDNGSLINVAVNGDVAANALGVANTGHITANGGHVVLTARVAGDVMKNIVNNSGIIEAESIADKNGIISLDGGDHGITAQSGILDVSGKNPGETGGTIRIRGDRVGLFAGSTVDASGDAGGGTVLIGGNFHGAGAEKNASMTYVDKDAAIQADALVSGDGGKVAVWADDATTFSGTISAKGGVQGGDGGFAEVSGKHGLTYAGLVDLGAPKGATGTLLLDPDEITITHGSTDTNISVAGTTPFTDTSSGSSSVLTDGTLNTQLGTASVSVATATGSITSLPDVDITLNSNTLTLQSAADINLAGTYRGTGTLNLNFASTLDLTTAPAFVGGPAVSAAGGGPSSTVKAAGGTWNLTGSDQGSVAGLTFTSAGNLIDTGAGTFNMGSGGSVTGNLDGGSGGTLDYSSYATPVTLNLAGTGTSGIGGSWSHIATVTGTPAITDTVTGSSKTYTLTGANAGNSGGVSWSSFETISDSGAGTLSTAGTQVYNLTGLNMGDVTTLLPGGFTGIGTLASTGAATFNMGTNGSVTGNLDGGTGGSLNYGSYAIPVTLDLAGTGTTGIGGSWSHIATVTGTPSNGDTVRGLNKTYTLDSGIADKGSSSGVTWSAFENITDTGAGIVKFGTAGSVSGNITAASGTLDYSGHAAAVNVNLAGTSGTTTGIGGTWSGISSITGSANSGDTITGATQTYALDNTLANKGSNGAVTWTGIENLTDSGTGTFNMGSGGRVSGNLDGGANGTLDYGSYAAPVTLNLSGTGTTGIGRAWSHITTVAGNANPNTVVGSNKTYSLDNSIANKGSNGGVTWTGFKNITDTGAGTFSMGSGGSVTGNLDGGLGGTLDYSSYTNPVTLNLSATGTTGIGGLRSGISTVAGSGNNDTISGTGKSYSLTAANAGTGGGVSWSSFEKIADTGTGTIATTGGQTYTLTGANSGTVATLLPGGFTGIGTLADSGSGTFRFDSGGAVTGNISAANGTLDYSAGIAGPVAVDLTAKSGTGIGGTWNGISTVTGSGAADTMGGANATYRLTAPNAGTGGGVSWSSFEKIADTGTGTIATTGGQTYTLTGANSGTVATLLPGGFTGIGTLADSGAGTFRFDSGGAVTGNISAANGTLDYSKGIAGPVAVDLTAKSGTGIGGTWNGITTMTGSGAADTMGGANATYSLTAPNAGTSGGVSWTSFENLHDTAAGDFKFGASGSVTGNISAANGTLDYSAGIAGPVAVDLTAKSGTGIGGTWNGITTVTGSGAADTMGGANATYSLTAPNAGTGGGVSWSSFEKIADTGTGTIATTGGQTYTLTGANSGTVAALLPGGFTGIGTLADSGAGTFRFDSGGAVTGNISAANGTLDYSKGIAGPVAVDLTAKSGTGIGGTWNGITTMTGSGASDTMGGANATYSLTAPNAGTGGGVSWSSFEKIADTGTGTLATTGGQTYTLTGANSGTVATLLPGGFTGISTLADSGSGTFRFDSGGAVTGNISAANGTLDYSAGIAGPVAVDLTAKSGTGIGGTWNGITTMTGSGASDTMGGANATYSLTAPNAGTGGGVSWTSFENLHDTAAGDFKFGATGSVTGNISAANGTLDYSAGIAGPVAVDLTAKTAPGIGGTWNGISTVTGSANASDTIIGSNQAFNLTGTDAGNNGRIGWTSFENITGVAGANSYLGSGGSLTGAITDSGSAATVQGPIQTGGAQTYSGPVTLGTAATLTSTGSGAITFAGTVNSGATPGDLTVGTSGVTTFGAPVGATAALKSLTVNAGGTTGINGGSVSTSGTAGQMYNNSVVLGADTTLNSGSGAITEGSSGSLTTAGLLTTLSGNGQNLVGNGTNSVAAFNATNTSSGDIKLTNGSSPLTITGINQTGGRLAITTGGAITGSGPLTVAGATAISAAGQPVTLTNAENDFGGTVTVAGATTRITDKNNLAAVLNTTGPTTLAAGADLSLSGFSTDAVTATANDKVTLSNPAASLLHIRGATITGTMNNATPLDLTTTSVQTPVTVNLAGSLPFLTYVGDVRANINSLGTYNGAVVMGSELDHYKSTVDLKSATTALIATTEKTGMWGKQARFDEFFTVAPMESIIDYKKAFKAPEAEPKLINH